MKILSGIRPSGHIHLGNYLGALKQWISLQETEKCQFFIADLHGLHTTEEIVLTQNILMAVGIHQKNLKYQRSFGKRHLQLYTQLQHYANIGHLSRMTQFKNKAEKESETAALLTYPVLMAADIFYNHATHVPVGNDQVQHLEFARDLWDKLPEPPFPKPQALIGKYPRIMSLSDGTKKMSKSDSDDMSRINVTDTADRIRGKILVAKTAMDMADDTPEMRNLKTIYEAVGGKEIHTRFKPFKDELAELIIQELQSTNR